MKNIRIILVDDHAVVRSGMRMLLEAQQDFEIVAEAETGAEAIKLASSVEADIILMDIQMPDVNGIDAGYVPKRAAPDEVVRAIRTVCRGEVFLYPSLATRLVQGYLRHAETDDSGPVYDDLTDREREVLTLIAEGLTNIEIAHELVISVKTVDRHRENIMRKLNMHSRIELVKYAIKTGLIELEE